MSQVKALIYVAWWNTNICLRFCLIHTDLVISTSHNFMPTKYFILTVLSFPICPVSVQRNTRCFSAINRVKWITSGLRSECTGTYISRLALFTEPQLLERRNRRGGSGMSWLGVQRHLSTQIHSKLFCGAQLSTQPAELLGSSQSRGSTFAELSKQLIGLCHDVTLQQFPIQKFHCWTV